MGIKEFFLTILNLSTGQKSLAEGWDHKPVLLTELEASWWVSRNGPAVRENGIEYGMVHVCHVGLEFGLALVFVVKDDGTVEVLNV